MPTLHKYSNDKIYVFDNWLSINMGAVIEFEPFGMWGDRVWQNKHQFVCTGIKRVESSGMNYHDYRFTQIGEASVSKEYNDIYLTSRDIERWYTEENTDTHEIRTPGGYVMFGKDEVEREATLS